MGTAKKGKIKTNVRVEPSVLNGLSKLSLAEPTGGTCGLFANSTDRSAFKVGGGERGTGSGCVGAGRFSYGNALRTSVEGGIWIGLVFFLVVRMTHTGAIRCCSKNISTTIMAREFELVIKRGGDRLNVKK